MCLIVLFDLRCVGKCTYLYIQPLKKSHTLLFFILELLCLSHLVIIRCIEPPAFNRENSHTDTKQGARLRILNNNKHTDMKNANDSKNDNYNKSYGAA